MGRAPVNDRWVGVADLATAVLRARGEEIDEGPFLELQGHV